jgi:hypothetical protein
MLIKRIGYYLVGLSLGIVAVYFFWQKKQATFDYGMDARTLKTIRIRERVFSDEAKSTMFRNNIDTLKISQILENGDVDFGKGKPRQEPCAEYFVTGKDSLKSVHLYIERCDSIATIQKVIID